MMIRVELDEPPDWDQQLLYVSIGEMFSVGIEFNATEVVFSGSPRDVVSCLAFYLMPIDIEEV